MTFSRTHICILIATWIISIIAAWFIAVTVGAIPMNPIVSLAAAVYLCALAFMTVDGFFFIYLDQPLNRTFRRVMLWIVPVGLSATAYFGVGLSLVDVEIAGEITTQIRFQNQQSWATAPLFFLITALFVGWCMKEIRETS